MLSWPRSVTARCIAATGATLFLAGCSDQAQDPPPCPADPLRGVYSPTRLAVLEACSTFVGTVATLDVRSDGDLKLHVTPDGGYERFLEPGNEGALVVEVMPGQHFPNFNPGDHLKIFGTWVFDTNNNWNEFHPVWSIEFLDEGRRYDVLPPATPLYKGDADD